MTAYFVGDLPSVSLAIVPTREGEEIDLTEWDTAEVFVDGTELTATITAEAVEAEWPETSLFEESGLLPVYLVLHTAAGAAETFAAEPLVVETMDGWHTLSTIRQEAAWARNVSDAVAFSILSASRYACEVFAPEVEDGEDIPLRYRQAQALQARNTYNAAKVSSSSEVDDPYSYTVRPLDWSVKALLRPQSGRFVIG